MNNHQQLRHMLSHIGSILKAMLNEISKRALPVSIRQQLAYLRLAENHRHMQSFAGATAYGSTKAGIFIR